MCPTLVTDADVAEQTLKREEEKLCILKRNGYISIFNAFLISYLFVWIFNSATEIQPKYIHPTKLFENYLLEMVALEVFFLAKLLFSFQWSYRQTCLQDYFLSSIFFLVPPGVLLHTSKGGRKQKIFRGGRKSTERGRTANLALFWYKLP